LIVLTLISSIDEFFNKTSKWQEEFWKLRSIILDCQLIEDLKWGKPCYKFQDNNVVLIHGFKEYCAILFFKGALLKDTKNILIQQTKNIQATRQIRFNNIREIDELESTLKLYIKDAIEIEKAGLKVPLKKISEYTIPEEFQNKLNENPALKSAFNKLTEGRQRAYLLYFSIPKQSKTRVSRIEKYFEQILKGKGLNNK
jgi:uncharacterized protein YdeI (YjbR/CyaY-like superfamily)